MKSKTMLTVAIAFSLVCVALVVYGVLSHKEAGFIKVCWKASTPAYDCYGGDPIVWGALPIKIHVVSHSGKQTDRDDGIVATRQAVDSWNDQMGFLLFQVVEDGPYDVLLNWGAPISTEAKHKEGGHVQHHKEIGGALTARVDINNTSTIGVTHLILMHELGHVVGLAHDGFPASPMYAVYQDNEDEAPMLIRITDSDRDLIRKTYLTK